MKWMPNNFYKVTSAILSVVMIQTASAEVEKQTTAQAGNYQLQPFHARYIAYRNGNDIGEAVMSLETTDEGYKLFYQSDVSIFFLSDIRSETSLFSLVDQRLVPEQYLYKREGTGPDKSLTLTFDDSNKTITIKARKKDPSAINWQGEWDNQLYRFDLQQQLQLGKTDVQYDLINYRGELKSYGFEVAGEEVLQLPFGKLNTIKVKTIRSSKRRVTWSWFAPDLNYQLVRLQQFKEGDEQGDIQLVEYQVRDTTQN